MKVLITGGSGFLGRCLSRYLHGHEVIVVSREDLDLLNADKVRQFLLIHKFDWVINCAVAGRNQVREIDTTILGENLSMFSNLYTSLDAINQGMITFGTGAEFGIDRDVDMAREIDIWNQSPSHSYGQSKNLIARLSSMNPKCRTIRIFGCFDSSEDSIRPIKKLKNCIIEQKSFVIEKDRWFDMISVADLVKIVQFVMTGACGFQDINAVYSHKTKLSDILRLYCKIHGYDPEWVQVVEQNGMSYTGDSSRIDMLNIPLLGLNKSLELYGN
jgi:nucleoside-diphosphate-sugar epimerase